MRSPSRHASSPPPPAGPYFAKAKTAALGLQQLRPGQLEVEVVEHASRDAFREWWFKAREDLPSARAKRHTSSPAAWLGANDFVGGADDTMAWLTSTFLAGGSSSRAPRVTHASDERVAPTPPAAGGAPGGAGDRGAFDYDLIVIGGGSGGLAASKMAMQLLEAEGAAVEGAPKGKVAVLDFVKPSQHGSTWGLGGTCVNVGCIPKKLMHTAALLGESLTDAKAYGWDFGAAGAGAGAGSGPHAAGAAHAGATHDWARMVSAVQDHISSLNFGYRVSLKDKGVEYKNALGAFTGPNSLELTDKKGKKTTVTARRFIVAVGGRPKPLDIPGGELALSSDDLFSLARPPGKTCVVGASYVALECAGFLAGLGYDTTVLVRSILLRGFDQQCSELIGQHMAGHGVRFVRPSTPLRIEKTEDGRLRVTWRIEPAAGAPADAAGVEESDVFDTVFGATGRYADTAKLNLAAVGVKTDRDGKIVCDNEQTTAPHIYAIGDVVAGKPELTPVAIAAGRALARRIYGGSKEGMDYDKVPTTVFTPLEYGCIGYSEEAAIATFGEENIEVYHSNFTPLEWTVVESRPQGACYAKLIVNNADSERVVGFHVLGPNAGAITQGFAVAMRLGATYESFAKTVGIHPTAAEEMTTLEITKRSGVDSAKTGC